MTRLTDTLLAALCLPVLLACYAAIALGTWVYSILKQK